MTDEYEPSEVARLIERRRKQRGLSVRAASAAAGLSEGRWRQIAKGYQQAAAGVRIPVNAPADTLRRMADSAGVQADELEAIGEHELANDLRGTSVSRLRHPSQNDEGLPPSAMTLVPDDLVAREVSRRLEDRKSLLEEIARLSAENRTLRRALDEPATVHAFPTPDPAPEDERDEDGIPLGAVAHDPAEDWRVEQNRLMGVTDEWDPA